MVAHSSGDFFSTYISAIKRILPRAVLMNLYNKKISKKQFTGEGEKEIQENYIARSTS